MRYERPRVVTLTMEELTNASLNGFLEVYQVYPVGGGGGGGCACQCQCQCQAQC
jgi:hypothetical protein